MRPAETLLLAIGIGRSAYGKWRIQRVLSVLATVAVLTVATAVMICALAIGGFYAAYLFLLSQGTSPLAALLLTGLLAVLFALVLLLTTRQRLKRLRTSMSTPVGEAIDAFFDGLFSE